MFFKFSKIVILPILLLLIFLLNGCITTKNEIMQINCQQTGKESLSKYDCYYQQALYLAIDGDYSNAISKCDEMLKDNVISNILQEIFFVPGEWYYNKCITQIAVISRNETIFSYIRGGFVDRILTFPSGFGISFLDFNKNDCLFKVQEEKRKRSKINENLWKCIVSLDCLRRS